MSDTPTTAALAVMTGSSPLVDQLRDALEDEYGAPDEKVAALLDALDAALRPTVIDGEVVDPKTELVKRVAHELENIETLFPHNPSTGIRERRKMGVGLSHFEQMAVLEFRQKGMKQVDIANRMRCDQATVSNILKKYQGTVPLARKIYEANAAQMAERVVKDADAKTVVDIHGRLGIIPKEVDSGNGGGGVRVYLGLKIEKDSK